MPATSLTIQQVLTLGPRRWRQRLCDVPDAETVMAQNNPVFIARNHRVEQMIAAAVEGDFAPFHRLRKVLARPYDTQPDACGFNPAAHPGRSGARHILRHVTHQSLNRGSAYATRHLVDYLNCDARAAAPQPHSRSSAAPQRGFGTI